MATTAVHSGSWTSAAAKQVGASALQSHTQGAADPVLTGQVERESNDIRTMEALTHSEAP